MLCVNFSFSHNFIIKTVESYVYNGFRACVEIFALNGAVLIKVSNQMQYTRLPLLTNCSNISHAQKIDPFFTVISCNAYSMRGCTLSFSNMYISLIPSSLTIQVKPIYLYSISITART